jgi:lipopolysaccharide/colanic/teichoic acid biosynthesis glycosyltransferase
MACIGAHLHGGDGTDGSTTSTWYARGGKRAFDIAASSALLVVAAPVLIGVAGVLRLRLGSDILFRQRRVGLDGQDFEMLKFRTMHHSRRRNQHPSFDGNDRRTTHKSSNDPRHTRIGRLLRRTSLDELPQLINVLRGDMSLVGPRPELASVVDAHDLRGHRRHTVKPGITGLWQVNRRNEGLLLHTCFDDDLPYLERITLGGDVKILVATAKVLSRPGGH